MTAEVELEWDAHIKRRKNGLKGPELGVTAKDVCVPPKPKQKKIQKYMGKPRDFPQRDSWYRV